MSHSKEKVTIDALLDKAKGYMKKDELKKIKEAYLFAKEKHEGQYSKTGEEYIFHTLEEAMILTTIYSYIESIEAALLH